jgi:uncharacterized membrane protein
MNREQWLNKPKSAQSLFLLSVSTLIILDLGLLLFRFIYSGSYNNWYLAWNLLLGTLPLLFSYAYFKYSTKNALFAWKNITLLALWILFLPNAFYLISDLVHLQESSNKMIVFDSVMFSAFGITGLLLGFLSIALIQYKFVFLPKKYTYLLVVGSLLVSSYAIYLGRYLRWNSWDVITNPFGIIFDISNSFLNISRFTKSLGTTILFFLFLMSLYIVFWSGVLYVKEIKPKRVLK